MWRSAELLMKNSSARIVKWTTHNLCFGLVVKVSKTWLSIVLVLVLMPKNLLACGGGGGGGGGSNKQGNKPKDEEVLNLTDNGLERNIQSAWDGWEVPDKIKTEWRIWNAAWNAINKKGEQEAGAIGPDGYGPGGRPDDYRGPGSSWPEWWSGLGAGNPGVPIPPWAYVPKNTGRPNICYLPPIIGECKPGENGTPPAPPGRIGTSLGGNATKPLERFVYSPFLDLCQSYIWSGCGAHQYRFKTMEECTKRCTLDPPPSCSDGSRPSKDRDRHRLRHPFDEMLEMENNP